MADFKGKVVLGVNFFNETETVDLVIRNGTNVLCVASPRYGKGALCKNLVVRASLFKRVCVFDYRGEWIAQVTVENTAARFPAALSDYFVAENFAFPITEFNHFGDWVGFGFEDDAANFMIKIVGSGYHGSDIGRVREMITKLPTKDDAVSGFNDEFGTDILTSIHPFTKSALGRRFEVVQRLFWKGPEDSRVVIDFERVVGEYRHLLIDLSDRRDGFRDLGKARAYAGIIARKIRADVLQWFFVVEEASQLLARLKVLPDGSQVGLSEFHKAVERWLTLSPKHGVNVLLLAQSKRQLYENLLAYLPVTLMGRLNAADVKGDVERGLNDGVLPVALPRKWWLLDAFFGRKFLFFAALPCCQYETN